MRIFAYYVKPKKYLWTQIFIETAADCKLFYVMCEKML